MNRDAYGDCMEDQGEPDLKKHLLNFKALVDLEVLVAFLRNQHVDRS